MGKELGLDIRAAIRALLASRAISAAAMLTLALAVGATTALFSVANGLMLRPLPVDEPERLATITSDTALRFGFHGGAGWSFAMWERLRERRGAFDGAFAWILQPLETAQSGESQPFDTLFASGDFFNTLGSHALLGRPFTAADDVRGGGPDGPVAVLSHDAWQRRFHGTPGVIGSRLLVEGRPVTIVGVARRGFRGVDVGRSFDLAMPLANEPLMLGARSVVDSRRAMLLTVMVRVKAADGIAGATAKLRAMQSDIVGPGVPPWLKEPMVLAPASTGITDRSQLRQLYARPLVTLLIVSALVLVIVCVNVGTLFVVRTAARRRDLSIRLAVGAPPWRLARQLFVEGLALGGVSALAGTIFAVWAGRALVASLPAATGFAVLDVPIDWRVLAFISATTVTAVVVFATTPALYAARVPSVEALSADRAGGGGGRSGSLTGAMIAAQIALSIVLVSAAAVFGRTLDRLAHVPLGFNPAGVIVMTVNASRVSADGPARLRVYERLLEAIAAAPGVIGAAGSPWTPFGTGAGGLLTDARGRRADAQPQVAFNFVTPGWFGVYGTALRAGRDFDGGDSAGAPRVAIINEALRRRLGENVSVGATIKAGPCAAAGCTVAGIVQDAVYGQSLRDQPPPTVYVPFAQSTGLGPPDRPFRIAVRGAADASRAVALLTDTVRSVEPAVTVAFRALDRDVQTSLTRERLVATLAGFFGVVALLLSAIGVFGVASFAVSRGRREIAIRLALGGQPARVLAALLARIGASVAAGALAGILAASWLSRFIAPLVYGLEPRDPATLLASTLVLVFVAGLAALLPAWRGTRVQPSELLRQH